MYLIIIIAAFVLIKHQTDSFAMTGANTEGQDIPQDDLPAPSQDEPEPEPPTYTSCSGCRQYAPEGFAVYSGKTQAECTAISPNWVYIEEGGCCCQTELSRCKDITCPEAGFDYAGIQLIGTDRSACEAMADNYCWYQQISQDAGGAYIAPLADSPNKECCCWNCVN